MPAGLLPVLPAAALPMRYVRPVLALGKRFARMRAAYQGRRRSPCD